MKKERDNPTLERVKREAKRRVKEAKRPFTYMQELDNIARDKGYSDWGDMRRAVTGSGGEGED